MDETSTGDSSGQEKRSDPEFSCVSLKSNQSMVLPYELKSEDTCSALRSIYQVRTDATEPVSSETSEKQPQDFNESMCHGFSYDCNHAKALNTLRSNLIEKCECLCEDTSQQRNPTILNEIYTELYITESESGEISNEHEVRQIEKQSRRAATEDKPIKCNNIFKPSSAKDKPIRTVLTKGVAGIGKTVSVQKFVLDWAAGKENQDVCLIFPLPFREINLMKDRKFSLVDLLHVFFPETKAVEISSDKYKVLFIFDGLDECRLSLDFHSSVRLCDVRESASVEVLLINLIRGNLLPSALIWITSRPAAADLIPSECVNRVTEVRGFSDPQKEEYFRRRISDESLACRIISHLKASRSLYIMCHIPVFCWISATVLEGMLSEAETGEIPKTLTQMYTHFLIIQTNIKHLKDYEKTVKDEDMVFKLGKLAFEQLVKGNLIFYEEDLRECDIDVAEASVYSGLCTQIFREELGWYQGKVYCFVHLTIQEHLAALYVHLSFINNNINVFNKTSQREKVSINKLYQKPVDRGSISDLHQRAIAVDLQSKNGQFDHFLRFLLGLSLESNQKLLEGLMTTGKISYSNEQTVKHIKKMIRKNPSPEKSISLFHCLNELGDHSLIDEIQHYLKSNSISEVKLSSSQWSALVFVLLTADLNVFNLNKYVRGNNAKNLKVLQKLLPVIQESRSVQLCYCNITDEGCAILVSALNSNPSHLTELDLSVNKLGDSGVKLLSAVMENPQCKLQKLRLSWCKITDRGCAGLASALKSNPSHLTELDLSQNKLGDSGVKLLSAGLENPHCKLEKLKLSGCNITDDGCADLVSVLISNPSHLTELNLSGNKLRDSGVKLLSAGLKNPQCKLEKLVLCSCNIKDEGCAELVSALRSNPSHLTELTLSRNKLGKLGVKLLTDLKDNPHYKLKTIHWSVRSSDDGEKEEQKY